MAAKNNRLFAIIIMSLFLATSQTLAQAEVQQDTVIQFAQKKIAESTLALSDKIEFCESLKKSPSPKFNSEIFESLEVKRDDILLALSHLNLRNSSKCENRLRVNLAYDLGVLASIHRYYQLELDAQTVLDVKAELIYPSVEEIKLSINYSKLPFKLKQYLENKVGEKPFDLLKILEINKLTKM